MNTEEYLNGAKCKKCKRQMSNQVTHLPLTQRLLRDATLSRDNLPVIPVTRDQVMWRGVRPGWGDPAWRRVPARQRRRHVHGSIKPSRLRRARPENSKALQKESRRCTFFCRLTSFSACWETTVCRSGTPAPSVVVTSSAAVTSSPPSVT